MKSKTPFAIMLSWLLLISCKPSNPVITISASDAIILDKKASDIIYDYHFILLDSVPDKPLGYITKVVFHQEMIFVHEKEFHKGIFVFNTEGKYLKKTSPNERRAYSDKKH